MFQAKSESANVNVKIITKKCVQKTKLSLALQQKKLISRVGSMTNTTSIKSISNSSHATKGMAEEEVANIDVMEDLNTFKATIIHQKIGAVGVDPMKVEEEEKERDGEISCVYAINLSLLN